METKIPKVQLEVWEWKEKAYNKIKDLPVGEVLKHIIDDTKDLEARIKNFKSKRIIETGTSKRYDKSKL